jgi:hypothetical protein
MTWIWSLGFMQPGKAVKTDRMKDGIRALLGHHGPTATKRAGCGVVAAPRGRHLKLAPNTCRQCSVQLKQPRDEITTQFLKLATFVCRTSARKDLFTQRT